MILFALAIAAIFVIEVAVIMLLFKKLPTKYAFHISILAMVLCAYFVDSAFVRLV